MIVRDLMTTEPLTIDPDATLREALEVMTREEIHELPVIQAGELVGFVTHRDLVAALGPAARSGEILDIEDDELDRPVHAVMAVEVLTVDPETTLSEACHALGTYRVGAMPVVDDDNRLVGILSVTDLLAAAALLFEREEG